jgi:hypothetical protein
MSILPPSLKLHTDSQLANIVVFLFSLGSNVYSVAGPDNMYGSSKEVYITPAPMAFWVWSLIHLLLLGTMFFQFTERGKEIIVDSIGWRFALLGVFNTVYIFFWSRHWYILAFVLSLYVPSSFVLGDAYGKIGLGDRQPDLLYRQEEPFFSRLTR